ncbi:MAG: DeoR/GlpR family DNA-binding transcription regulator [Candidatus Marinimicrobia bacterium]|nr:DeoR/GlpR family DNA-binding transcription regulator [Candidatus Neomarinimicrobiota bacterium]
MATIKPTAERRNQIKDLISHAGRVKVDILSARFGVSEVTIRGDLKHLEDQGVILRSYGGAQIREPVGTDVSILQKRKLHADEKRRIGAAAAALIHDGDSIILDSGTTTSEVVKFLDGKKRLTIMTNAVNIATELAGHPNSTVMLTGGVLREKSFSLVGIQAELMLKEYHFDKVFLGVDGFDLESGLTTPNPYEAHLNSVMAESAKEVIVLTDSSKFGLKSLVSIMGLDRIDRVITDKNIPLKYLKVLEERNISVTLV